MSNTHDSIHLCSTPRLARALRDSHNKQAKLAGKLIWETPLTMTLTQWLQMIMEQAMLSGDMPAEAFPAQILSTFSENIIWQQAIESCLQKHELHDLFDIVSLADAAQQANQFVVEWQIANTEINTDFLNVETRQFLRWRSVFHELCKKHNALEPSRILAFQASILENCKIDLPKSISLHGFDRMTPLLTKLLQRLRTRGVKVEIMQPNVAKNTHMQIGLEDIQAECRAAVAWGRDTLQANPQARLAIVSPVLQQIRRPLQDLLDDTFHPNSPIEAARIYDFSLGEPLADNPLISTALNILRIACNPRPVLQTEISNLLLDVYWSSHHERPLRSQIDAYMRSNYSRSMTLEKLLQIVKLRVEHSALLQHLHSICTFKREQRPVPPSSWRMAFKTLLKDANWGNSRPLSSHEFQAQRAWEKLLLQFAALDAIYGKLSGVEAVRQLRQMAAQQLHQPENESAPSIQVLGMLETPAEALDGVWVIGMNDTHWPPAPRPNPLLPYALQRTHAMPAADSATQTEFGALIFTRLKRSAAEVIFSHAKHADDRELRASPLLTDLAILAQAPTILTRAEQLATPKKLEILDDRVAPPVTVGEQVRGGTKLLEAQAICPAWAFYQYRLCARKLETPSDGLDQMLRGSLVHAALQHFWQAHPESQVLQQADLPKLIADAVDTALAKNPDLTSLPEALIYIERKRLNQLLETWLALEATREPFSVQACEQEKIVDIQGLQIRCRIDRIDALPEGLVVLDYKTGTLPKMNNWAGERVTEPQLPFYASIVLQNEQVVGACFARVNVDECKLEGASNANIGASFKPMNSLKSLSGFTDFEMLLNHWHTQLSAIATEIMSGVADVRFTDENDLSYCDVKPLMRLPEREWQFEQGISE